MKPEIPSLIMRRFLMQRQRKHAPDLSRKKVFSYYRVNYFVMYCASRVKMKI